MGYGVANAVIATLMRIPPTRWTAWPTEPFDTLKFVAAVFVLPVVIALAASWLVEFLAEKSFLVSGHPTAWDRLVLARLRSEPFFVLATFPDGRKLGGAFLDNGYASNYPYDRDIFIDQVWNVDQATGRFVELVQGEAVCTFREKTF